MPKREALREHQSESPEGTHASEWDRPLTEEDAPWQAVWTLGGRFAHPGRRRPPPGADRRLPLSQELSRSRVEGLGGRAWHWLATLGALAALLLGLRLLSGGAGGGSGPRGLVRLRGRRICGGAPGELAPRRR